MAMVKPGDLKIGIIGMGHMGKALRQGLLNHGVNNIMISNRSEDNSKVIQNSDWIFLAVKPNKVSDVLNDITVQEEPKVLISLAAGIKLRQLQQLSKGKNMKVVRIMPNLAIQNNTGVIGVYFGRQEIEKTVMEKLSLLGSVIQVKTEKDLDILTIIAGCTPAILAYFAQAFKNFSGKSEDIVIKSFMSSLNHIQNSGQNFDEIIEAVATRGGITENILNSLEKKNVGKNIHESLRSGYLKLEKVPK